MAHIEGLLVDRIRAHISLFTFKRFLLFQSTSQQKTIRHIWMIQGSQFKERVYRPFTQQACVELCDQEVVDHISWTVFAHYWIVCHNVRTIAQEAPFSRTRPSIEMDLFSLKQVIPRTSSARLKCWTNSVRGKNVGKYRVWWAVFTKAPSACDQVNGNVWELNHRGCFLWKFVDGKCQSVLFGEPWASCWCE